MRETNRDTAKNRFCKELMGFRPCPSGGGRGTHRPAMAVLIGGDGRSRLAEALEVSA